MGSIPTGAWIFVVSVLCCQVEVSATSCFTRSEESYRLCCVVVCDLETSRMRRPWPALCRSATGKKKLFCTIIRPLETSSMLYSKFLSQSEHFDLLFVGVDCYYHFWSHSMTHTHTLNRIPLDERSANRRDSILWRLQIFGEEEKSETKCVLIF
jgi:hypothetical protein